MATQDKPYACTDCGKPMASPGTCIDCVIANQPGIPRPDEDD